MLLFVLVLLLTTFVFGIALGLAIQQAQCEKMKEEDDGAS